MNRWFSRFAMQVSLICGKSYTFATAILALLLWAITGPYFHYSDSWQLVMNSATTAITFLMVFLVQNSQTRDATAMQIKLDELIRVSQEARNRIIDVENTSDAEIAEVKKTLSEVREQ